MSDNDRDRTEAIVEYDPIERTLAEFRGKYAAAVYDVTTTEGFVQSKSAAREGRKALVELEKIRKRIKEPALRRCQRIDADAKRLASGIGAIFDPLFRQVDVEQQRQDNARAEAERVERQRITAIQMTIADLSRPVAFGATTAEIAERLAFVESVAIGAAFGEFEDDAFFAKDCAVRALREVLAKSQAGDIEREAAAERDAELARQRRENERLRREAEERERLDRESLRLAEVDRTVSATVTAALPEQVGHTLFRVEQTGEDDRGPRTVTDGWPRPKMTQELIDDMGQPIAMVPPHPAELADYGPAPTQTEAEMARERDLSIDATLAGGGSEPDTEGSPLGKPFPVSYDPWEDVLTVCGVRYSGTMFRELGLAPTGRWLQIVGREGGVITCRTVSDDLAREFDNLIIRDEAFRGLRRDGKGL